MKTLLLFALIFTISCSKKHQLKKEKLKEQTLNSDTRSLSASEKQIAHQICDAYRDKRVMFPGRYAGLTTNIAFTLNDRPCGRGTSTFKMSAALKKSLVFETIYQGQFIKPLETDQAGFIKNMCTSLFLGQNPPLQENFGVDKILQFNFVSNASQTGIYEVVEASRNTVGNFVINRRHKYEVELSAGNLLGLVKKVSRVEMCSDSSESLFEQIFSGLQNN